MKTQSTSAVTLVELMVVLAIIGLLAAIAIPNFIHAHAQVQQNTCMNNLRKIDASKQEWSLDKKPAADAVPTADDIKAYMGQTNGILLSCPSDTNQSFATSYRINPMNKYPTCLVDTNHSLTVVDPLRQ